MLYSFSLTFLFLAIGIKTMDSNVFLESALVDMYVKLDNWENGHKSI